MPICRWFARCKNEATNQVEHPTLGWVDICDKHLEWLGDNPSPTMFVPPLAAAVLDRHRASAVQTEATADDLFREKFMHTPEHLE